MKKEKNNFPYIEVLIFLGGFIISIISKLNIENNSFLFGFILMLYSLHLLNSKDIKKLEKLNGI